jgi:hypothetical protein
MAVFENTKKQVSHHNVGSSEVSVILMEHLMLGHLGRIYSQAQERATSCSPSYQAQITTLDQMIQTIIWFAVILCC